MSKDRMKLNVYGRLIYVERVNDEWLVYYQSVEGKRRRATSIVIPSDLDRSEVVTYIADLLHEFASESNSAVEVLDQGDFHSPAP